ncbi:tungstate transport system substrate-binding protein [Methanolinea mesophila]|uniref:substrate-binding domain-containing protein n=1 Tax=Methanolinea mesophila TaxID=547055 RepID=UPI001FD75E0F|nr:substrate-binding domain-containing protein [Methanolinea mesophila]MBP1929552.1 tungstate transport system substrate-binding protein [Methanolinea mesophila]
MVAMLLGAALFAGCTTTPAPGGSQTATPTPTAATGETPQLLIATTTSLYDTGLWDYLQQMYESTHDVKLLITSQGTGKAIELAINGDADILAVHSPAQEAAFIANGSGLNSRCFAYNYFIIVGPADDPAGVANLTPEEAFLKIREQGMAGTPGVFFVSRGDNSGTHSAEKAIWKNAKLDYATQVEGSGNWYVEAGSGMGATLQLASEKGAYTLTDEGTFLAYKGQLDLVPVISSGASLLNRYSVMTVYYPGVTPQKLELGNEFVDWMISPDTQTAIGEYGVSKYGKPLFTPMFGNCSQFNCDCSSPATLLMPSVAPTKA